MGVSNETRYTSINGTVITGVTYNDGDGYIEVWQEDLSRGKKSVVRLVSDETMTPVEAESFVENLSQARIFVFPESTEPQKETY